MMDIYLKGYYGYKNIGDELLLLGVINWLYKKHTFTALYIESDHPLRLTSWISRHEFFLDAPLDRIVCQEQSRGVPSSSFKIFGGGEVITDARPFPYNGWNYLIKYFPDIMSGNFALLGGIGSPKKLGSGLLWKILLGRAQYIVTREDQSTTVAEQYSDKVTAHEDFGATILQKLTIPDVPQETLLINLNPYIASSETVQQIIDFTQQYPDLQPRYLPGDIGEDTEYYHTLKQDIPGLKLYDWTSHSLDEIIAFVAGCKQGIAARLHVLFLLDRCDVPFTPLVYQEKITKFFPE